MSLYKYLFFIIILSAVPLSLFCQIGEWTEEMAEDGKTTVLYKFYKLENDDGTEIKIIEYSAITYTSASLENCSVVFNNPSMHKRFYDYTERSEKIKDISENEWIIYYYYDSPWPLPNSDCVSRITMIEDSLESSIIFNCVAEPNLLEDKGVIRSIINDISFTFKKLSNEKVEISIRAKFSPAMSAPDWMMGVWFPNGPAEILAKLKALAENQTTSQ